MHLTVLGHCCRRALASLRFEVDGEDLTGADARLTQAAIERQLAVGLLARASFHGQADITALLEVPLPCPCDPAKTVLQRTAWPSHADQTTPTNWAAAGFICSTGTSFFEQPVPSCIYLRSHVAAAEPLLPSPAWNDTLARSACQTSGTLLASSGDHRCSHTLCRQTTRSSRRNWGG